MSQKISEFVVDNAVTDSSLITYVKDGQNFAVTQAEYVKLFGVTGSIVQEGASSGTPILDVDGTVNNIRNVEDGPGILSGVSPENGLELSHNFTRDLVGQTIFLNPTAQQPKFVSLLQGDGISISRVDDHLTIAVSGLAASTNTVVVNTIADFPAAVGGVITLVGGTNYFLTNSMTTSDRFNVDAGDIVFQASDSSVVTFTYTGTGDLFTGTDATFRIGKIAIVALTGRLWNLTNSTGGALFQFIDGSIRGCDKIGIFNGPSSGYGAIQFNNVAFFGVITDGVEFTGTVGAFVCFATIATMVNAGDFLNLGTATFGSFNVDDALIDLTGASTVFLSGAAASANILSGGLGVILNSRVRGPGAALSGITPDDDLWRLLLNDDIRDSRTDGLLSMQGNAVETVITGSSTDGSNAVLVAGTWTVGPTSQMDGTAAGKLTHNGGKDARLPVTGSVTVEPASGGNILINAYIVIDGVVDVDSRQGATTAAGNPTSITLPWQNTYPDGGFSEIYLENTQSTVNLIASSAVHRVN